MSQDHISDEYINDFFERVEFRNAPSKVRWQRAAGLEAFFRDTLGSIEIGWLSVQDSRTDEPRDVGPLFLGPMWFTGDFDTDVEQFYDLMKIWVVHEMGEHLNVDGSLWRDHHDMDVWEGSYEEVLRREFNERWKPAPRELLGLDALLGPAS
jgi:hypothetical protein